MKGNIQTEDTLRLSEKDIIKIWEIEQDGWAHGLWEYRKCNDCWHVHSKQDIHGNLSRDEYTNTVKQIERLLGYPDILCQICTWNTSEIFWEEYIESIRDRYKNYTSYISTFRDDSWEIQWFLDGYISSFSNIYEKEFSAYYNEIWETAIREHIERLLERNITQELLTTNALCLHEKHKSMYIIYNLIKTFYRCIEMEQPNMIWIYESMLWTNTHAIYEALWWKPIWIKDIKTRDNVIWWKDYKSDIFIHENIWETVSNNIESDLKNFLRINSRWIRKIIKIAKN